MGHVLDATENTCSILAARRGICLVLVSPSGGGKTSIMHRLLSDPGVSQSVSVTTRSPRPGEHDGLDYYFRSDEQFDRMVAEGEMLEHAQVMTRRYGIPRAPVEQALARGRDLVFAIDWKGNRTLREKLPYDVVSVFLVPPSLAELEKRLVSRGDSVDDTCIRLREARLELGHWSECDHLVVNASLDEATCEVRAILQAARTAGARNIQAAELAADMAAGPTV
jgi:guanylate kinase